jgi:hypothetical protein
MQRRPNEGREGGEMMGKGSGGAGMMRQSYQVHISSQKPTPPTHIVPSFLNSQRRHLGSCA